MTTLRIETLRIPASHLGPENPLPELPRRRKAGAATSTNAADPGPAEAYFEQSHIDGCLPYRIQDGYDRSDAERPLETAVLENETLRATFLLELGGRLWSLVHKPTGRELLFQPKVLHFANVALRNAWFCGGVEWNIAVRGHVAHTCAPVFAAEVRAGDGAPALRLYEWDRFRGLEWQIDFLLLDEVPALLARPRIVNPNASTTPTYWWSNIAVAEAEGHRVLAPAENAYHFGYSGQLEPMPVPMRDGVDTSYPTRIASAHDYFYRIPDGNRPWIASLDAGGAGLVHASTARLRGRKLFVWGMDVGGRRWQGHLGGRGTGYVEIQAGLGRTQQEYLPMPARADWAWLEAYALIEADPAVVHADDWTAAHRHVEARLDAILPQPKLESLLAETADLADRRPHAILQRGSGWGALEQRRRLADGERAPRASGIVFDEASLGPDQAPWLALLDAGALPRQPASEAPGAWTVAPAWHKRLAEAADAGRGDHWLTWLHLGVMAYSAGETGAAERAWQTSLAREPSAWAYRNLAVLANHAGRADEAADLYLKAAALRPDLAELQLECGRALADADRATDLQCWLEGLPGPVRRLGRIEFLAARAALARGRLDEAEQRLEHIELADVREGEVALTDLWFAIREQRVAAAEGVPIDDALKARVRQTHRPPAHLDFRMSGG